MLSTLEPDQDSQGGSKGYTQEDAKKPQELLDPVSLPGSSSLALIDDVDSGGKIYLFSLLSISLIPNIIFFIDYGLVGL